MSTLSQQGLNCTKCRKLPTTWPCSKFVAFEYHENFRALDQSAAAGCPLCRIVRQIFIFEAETSQLMATPSPIIVSHSGPSYISVHIDDDEVTATCLLEVKEAPKSASTTLVPSSRIRRKCNNGYKRLQAKRDQASGMQIKHRN